MRESESTITDEVPASVGYRRVLDRSVALLEHNTAEARRAIYAHARSVIAAQLVRRDPLPSEAEIARESEALAAAIREGEAAAMPGAEPALRPRANAAIDEQAATRGTVAEAEAQPALWETGAVSR